MLKKISKKIGNLFRLRARVRVLRKSITTKTEDKPRKSAPAEKTPERNHRSRPDSRSRNKPAAENRKPRERQERQERKPDYKPQVQEKPSRKPSVRQKPAPPPMPEIVPVPPEEGKCRFTDLELSPEIMAGVQSMNFKYCTAIQEKCLPHAIAGKDLAAKAQTGTGKTAAFLASAMTRMLKNPIEKRAPGTCRALVLAPTRELAIQIHKDALATGKYTNLNNLVIFGGMDHKGQRDSLLDPVDILVGTPGRIIDYSRSGHLNLSQTEILIIDEADRMLDMGFIPDVRRIVSKLPPAGKRQTMLFSATLEPEILALVDKWLIDPVSVEAEPEHVVTDLIDQTFYAVLGNQKFPLLLHMINNEPFTRMIIFGNWKEKNRTLARKLCQYGVKTELLSGDIAQEKRIKILDRFKRGDTKVLVATDVAARGLHVDGISHVVNYDIPDHADDYVHRIGRTGRAGVKGKSISFVCEVGAYTLPEIEKYIGMPVKTVQPEDNMLVLPEKPATGVSYDSSMDEAEVRPHSSPHGGGRRSGGYGRDGGRRSGGRPGSRRR